MMFNLELKAAWADSAYDVCFKGHGELSPARGAFSGYLTRLFKRESLSHLNQDNFLDNISFIRKEIDKDIKEDKASTGRVAEYISLALDKVLSREVLVTPEITTQKPQGLSARGPR